MTQPSPAALRPRRARPRAVVVATAVTATLAIGALAAPPATAQTYYVPVDEQLVVTGHGYGHGRGMSQHGAHGAALQGKGYRQILGFYYPGTSFDQVQGQVRVLISADVSSDLQVSPRTGLRIRDLGDGSAWTLPVRAGITRWRIRPEPDVVQYLESGRWHTWTSPSGRTLLRGDGEFAARGPIRLWTSDTVSRAYRGRLRAATPYPGATARDTVNVLSMDRYVRGVVPYEMPASWAAEALKSQAVAARTYATYQRSLNLDRYYQICDTTACQVYGGVAAETPTTNSAVAGTARQVLVYGGRPALTQFSSSSGGFTASGGLPYLPAQRDPWDDWSGNTVHDWQLRIDAGRLERLYPRLGNLVAVRVTRRTGDGQWHGRALQVVLDGTDADVEMSGDDFRWTVGLRSTWFTIERTPIMERWASLGGRGSVLGRPISGEYAVTGGATQRFEHGRIFWTGRIGAREVYGPILRRYRGLGGEESGLGYPRSGVRQVATEVLRVVFERGHIYTSPDAGAHPVRGGFLRAYLGAGGAAGRLGPPVSDVRRVEGGRQQDFRHGRIRYVGATDTFTVHYG